MKITVDGGIIRIDAEHINPEKRIHTDARLCVYNEKVYIYTHTKRYWQNSARGNVVELRSKTGRKIKEVGSNEISGFDPVYWGDMERDGRVVPKNVIAFFNQLKEGVTCR
jgi:hypothetical protein